MTSLLLTVALAISGQVKSAGQVSSASSAAATETPPAFHEYQASISDALKQESQAKDHAARTAAIRGMCDLHEQLVSDARYSTSDTLKQYRSRLWSRLTKIKTDLKRELTRDKGNVAAFGDVALEDAATLERADAASVAAADSLATSLSLLDQTQGGPGQLLAFGGRAVEESNGRALVELIERTINPAFWETVGGPGSIVYYAPLQCLVVRATSEVHGQIGGLVGDVRDAGK